MARRSTSATTIVSVLALASCGMGEARENGDPPVVEPIQIHEPHVERAANAPLRAMSEYLSQLDEFTVVAEGTFEIVLDSGQKLAYPYTSEVAVRRPNRLRGDGVAEGDERLQFFYDGRSLTLFGTRTKLYARAPAPPTVGEAVEVARERLGFEAPGADLLRKDPYAALIEGVVSGFRAGTASIDGVRCHHLAFRTDEIDWQIWIEDGPRPLPRRLLITSRLRKSAPQFVVELSQWSTEPSLSDEMFTFTPPPEAKQIDFLAPKMAPSETHAELPARCTSVEGPKYVCGGTVFVPYYQGTRLVYVPSNPPETEAE